MLKVYIRKPRVLIEGRYGKSFEMKSGISTAMNQKFPGDKPRNGRSTLFEQATGIPVEPHNMSRLS